MIGTSSVLSMEDHSVPPPTASTLLLAEENDLSTKLPQIEKPTTKTMESQRIRNKLLNKVGIMQLQNEQREPNNREPSRGSLLGNVAITKEPLKYEDEEEQPNNFFMNLFSGTPSSVDSESCSTSSHRSTSRLTFSEDVAVVPIPQRSEYSQRVKSRMWSSPEEIQMNAERNAMVS
uniref:Uncharacterized protein n=1 Tax=Grammatophora oceanica TaxID=210454 RepID=A0A7S1Y458_9STRA